MGPLTREANRDLFLIILVESHVVLSNDEKKEGRQGKKKEGGERERKRERGEIQGPWQVTKSGV